MSNFPDWLADLLVLMVREVEPSKRHRLTNIARAASEYVNDMEFRLLNAQEEINDRLDYIERLEWYGEPDFDDEEVV